MSKGTNFIKQCVAFLAGDTDDLKALKIQRAAESALEAQIAVKKGAQIALEDAITDCEEAEQRALYNNGELLGKSDSHSSYVEKLIRAHNATEEAKEALEDHKKLIDFLKTKLSQVREGKES